MYFDGLEFVVFGFLLLIIVMAFCIMIEGSKKETKKRFIHSSQLGLNNDKFILLSSNVGGKAIYRYYHGDISTGLIYGEAAVDYCKIYLNEDKQPYVDIIRENNRTSYEFHLPKDAMIQYSGDVVVNHVR